MMRNININGKNNDYNYQNNTRKVVNNLNLNEPKYYKTLKYHADTISQMVFNPNK